METEEPAADKVLSVSLPLLAVSIVLVVDIKKTTPTCVLVQHSILFIETRIEHRRSVNYEFMIPTIVCRTHASEIY